MNYAAALMNLISKQRIDSKARQSSSTSGLNLLGGHNCHNVQNI